MQPVSDLWPAPTPSRARRPRHPPLPDRRPSLTGSAALGGARAPLVARPRGAGGSYQFSSHLEAVQPVSDLWPAPTPSRARRPRHPPLPDRRPSLTGSAALGGARAPLVARPRGAGGSYQFSSHLEAVQPDSDLWPAPPSRACRLRHPPLPDRPGPGPEWVPSGWSQVGPEWVPSGSQVGPRWVPSGFQVGPES